MTKSWPYMPGVPAAGHVTAKGFWHSGAADGCPKCEPPRVIAHDRTHTDPCQRGTTGCSINHTAERTSGSCETW